MTASPPQAIAFLCHRPQASQIRFYESCAAAGYRVYIVVDDLTWPQLQSSTLTEVRISDECCYTSGFHHFNPAINKPGNCSAWDKALFYLHHSTAPSDYCWLLEDDVYLTQVEALQEMDRRYPHADLLVGSCQLTHQPCREPGTPEAWVWFRHVPAMHLPLPWAHGMVCAARISRRLIEAVGCFIDLHASVLERRNLRRMRLATLAQRLRLPPPWVERIGRQEFPFIEYIFHTLALHHGFEITVAEEMNGLLWRHSWTVEQMRPDRLYHPVKDIAEHEHLRAQLLQPNQSQ